MLKVRTLFSGIGSPESALKNLEIPYELVDFCEVDKYAVKSYCAVHGVSEDKNLGDITKVWGRNLSYADLLVWGFPCQDISVAGKQRGLKEGETRSGLYYEGFRILKETKPKYSVIENVKNLIGKKFKADFESMLEDIESLGYNNYWKVLNAKDYGIPQNRERVFIVSIRKDIDTGTFSFPKGFDNGLRLKDFLENEVEEKYYIDNAKTEKLLKQLDYTKQDLKGIDLTINQPKFKDYANCIKARYDCGVSNQKSDGTGICLPCITPDRVDKRQNGRRFKEDGEPMFTLTSQDRHGILQVENNRPQRIGNIYGEDKGTGFAGNVWDKEALSPTLTTMQGGNREPMILEANVLRPVRTEYGKVIRKQYEAGEIAEKIGNMRELRPREDGISNTLTTVQKDNLLLEPKIIEDFYANRDIRVYDDCPTLRSERNGLKVAVKEATKKGYAEATVGDSINIQFPNSETRRGRVGVGVAQTLETSCNQATLTNDYRIRKLTPKECWRLMGFKDEEFERAAQVNSNSQLYKQAGNSIVTNCLFYIFKSLLQAEINAIYEENKTLS